VETVLDAEMPDEVIGPDQADCGGLLWTRTFSWKAEGRQFDPVSDHQSDRPETRPETRAANPPQWSMGVPVDGSRAVL